MKLRALLLLPMLASAAPTEAGSAPVRVRNSMVVS